MHKLETMKERYDQIIIPEELNIRIQQEPHVFFLQRL